MCWIRVGEFGVSKSKCVCQNKNEVTFIVMSEMNWECFHLWKELKEKEKVLCAIQQNTCVWGQQHPIFKEQLIDS